MNNLTTIANTAAVSARAADAGVVVAVLHGADPEFSIWAIGRNGRINEHRLNAGCTDLARLTAHVEGFVANHLRAWA
jgi:hypothetical protein